MQYDQLFTALSKAQAEMTDGKAQGINPQFKSSYARFEDVWEAIRKPFVKHGLCVMQNMGFHEGKWCIFTVVGHSSGQHITSYTPIIDTSSAKNPSQAFGSAVTYAKKYALASACGFCVSDKSDDDGEECMNKTNPPIKPENPQELLLTQGQLEEIFHLSQNVPGVRDQLQKRLGANIGLAIKNQKQAFYHEIVAFAKKVEEFKNAS